MAAVSVAAAESTMGARLQEEGGLVEEGGGRDLRTLPGEAAEGKWRAGGVK